MTRKEGQRRRRRACPEEIGGFGFLTGTVRAAVMVGITLVIFLTYIASQL